MKKRFKNRVKKRFKKRQSLMKGERLKKNLSMLRKLRKKLGYTRRKRKKGRFLPCARLMMFLLWRRLMEPRKHLGLMLVGW